MQEQTWLRHAHEVLTPAEDSSPGDWLTASVGTFGTVHSFVPDAFNAYARVFHPGTLDGSEVRWGEVAAANGRTMHGAAEWGQITGSWSLHEQPGLWSREPDNGQTPPRLALRLAAILAAHTSTPQRCWFGVWEGWGEPAHWLLFTREETAADKARAEARLEERRTRAAAWHSMVQGAPTFEMPSRRYHLLNGPLTEIERFYEEDADAPSIWWPEDRAWCVGSDVDLMTTYLGGTAAAVDAVLADGELEALAIPAGQDVTWKADTLNPPAGEPPF